MPPYGGLTHIVGLGVGFWGIDIVGLLVGVTTGLSVGTGAAVGDGIVVGRGVEVVGEEVPTGESEGARDGALDGNEVATGNDVGTEDTGELEIGALETGDGATGDNVAGGEVTGELVIGGLETGEEVPVCTPVGARDGASD